MPRESSHLDEHKPSKAKSRESKSFISRPNKDSLPINPINSLPGVLGRYGDSKEWRKINGGAFGEVFRAFDSKTNTTVVIKRMPLDKPKLLEVFENEALILKHLHSHCRPYFVCFVDAFRTKDHAYVIMEFLDQYIDLFDFIIRHHEDEKLSHQQNFTQVRKIMTNCIKGLQEMHKLEIAHRDIKPENIMVCISAENFGAIKFIDFGLSCMEKHCEKDKGQVLGTMVFLAPEQSRGELSDLDSWKNADNWQLGVTFFALLSRVYFNAAIRAFLNPEDVANKLLEHSKSLARKYLVHLKKEEFDAVYPLELEYLVTMPDEDFQSDVLLAINEYIHVKFSESAKVQKRDFEWCQKVLLNLIVIDPTQRLLTVPR